MSVVVDRLLLLSTNPDSHKHIELAALCSSVMRPSKSADPFIKQAGRRAISWSGVWFRQCLTSWRQVSRSSSDVDFLIAVTVSGSAKSELVKNQNKMPKAKRGIYGL